MASKPASVLGRVAVARRRWWYFGGALLVVVALIVIGSIALTQTHAAAPKLRSAGVADSPTPSARASATPAPSSSTPPTSTSEPANKPTNAPAPMSTAAPQPLDKPADPVSGVTVQIESLQAVSGTGGAPGEIAGPSIRFGVKITNNTAAAVSLAPVVVNAYYGSDSRPAVQLSGPGASPLPAQVSSGASAVGVFVYNVPRAQRDKVRITVDFAADVPEIVFEGSAPR